MKRKMPVLLFTIALISLACSFGANTPEATPTIIEVTPTLSPFAAEEANAGAHHYWMSPNEVTCDASDDVKIAQFRDKEHIFTPDFSSVTYGNFTYPRVGDHRYQSINQDEKPLVLVYSEHGYILFVYKPGDNPDVNDPCLSFSFTLAD